MKNFKLTKIIALVLCAVCLASCTTPAGPGSDPVTDPVTDPAGTSDISKIVLVDNGKANAVIVRGDKASASVNESLSTLRDYIKLKTGARIDAKSDFDFPDRAPVEIVVGYSNRLTKEDAKVRKSTFQITSEIVDGKQTVYLLGYSDIYVQCAVDHFIAHCIETDGNSLWVAPDIDEKRLIVLNDYEEEGASVINRIRDIDLFTKNTQNKNTSLKAINNIHAITMLTGELSLNRTRTMYNICGTDLGFPVYHNGKLWFFFGDTFSEGEMSGGWRTNTAAYTSDLEYEDGIVFDGMYSTDSDGFATEMIKGLKKPYTEYSKIPTGAISLDGTLYFFFMSVNNWDDPAGWACNYGGLAKSEDDGKTWSIVSGVQWPGDTKFCQNAPALNEEDGKIYITGIRGGRTNPARMMRVDKDKIEDFNAYEYLTGYDADGNAIWTAGEEGMRSEFYLIDAKVSENTINYNPYLEEWMIIFKKDSTQYIYTSKNPAGPYDLAASFTFESIGAGLYGGFTCPALWKEDGRKMVLVMSTWEPCYNVFLLEITLEKAK